MAETVLRGALVDGQVRDVTIGDGLIAAVTPPSPAPSHDGAVDLDGYLLLPSAVEPHAHLDKAFLADVVPNPAGDLAGAIEAMRSQRATSVHGDTVARAVRAGRLMATNGYTAVRTHVDVTTSSRLASLQAVLDARRALTGVIDVEIVALCGSPITGVAGADQRALLADALDLGADLIGGCPHLEPDGTRTATEYLVEVAAERQLAVDLHTDETLDPTVRGIVDLIAAVDAGFAHPVTASHCVSLGMLPDDEQRHLAGELARTGIGVIANPYTNLYLQGRSVRSATPRGLTAIAALREARVAVAAGHDNLQDPFNPFGRGDPLDVARLMCLAAHLRLDDAFATVSSAARAVTGRPPVRVEPGSPADLLAVRAASLRDAMATTPSGDGDRLVFRRGRLVPAVVHAAAVSRERR